MDAGALFGRQSQHQVFDRTAERVARRIDRHDAVRPNGTRLCLLSNFASADEIDTSIMRNLEKPRRQRTDIVEAIQLVICMEPGVLNDVLTVQDPIRSCGNSSGAGWGGGWRSFQETPSSVLRKDPERRRQGKYPYTCFYTADRL